MIKMSENLIQNKIICPCCKEYTIDKNYYLFNICEICFWEYDPVQNDDPNYAGGANCHSLNEYKKEFERKRKENPNFNCKNEKDKQYMIEWDHKKSN